MSGSGQTLISVDSSIKAVIGLRSCRRGIVNQSLKLALKSTAINGICTRRNHISKQGAFVKKITDSIKMAGFHALGVQ